MKVFAIPLRLNGLRSDDFGLTFGVAVATAKAQEVWRILRPGERI
jgi:hypothetical protein